MSWSLEGVISFFAEVEGFLNGFREPDVCTEGAEEVELDQGGDDDE